MDHLVLNLKFGLFILGGVEMIANEMKEYCYSEDEMRAFIGGSKGPIAPATMRRRIRNRTNCPPWIKVGPDYWFPKDLYGDWLRELKPTYEVSNAS